MVAAAGIASGAPALDLGCVAGGDRPGRSALDLRQHTGMRRELGELMRWNLPSSAARRLRNWCDEGGNPPGRTRALQHHRERDSARGEHDPGAARHGPSRAAGGAARDPVNRQPRDDRGPRGPLLCSSVAKTRGGPPARPWWLTAVRPDACDPACLLVSSSLRTCRATAVPNSSMDASTSASASAQGPSARCGLPGGGLRDPGVAVSAAVRKGILPRATRLSHGWSPPMWQTWPRRCHLGRGGSGGRS
jgi:hypothetical protein